MENLARNISRAVQQQKDQSLSHFFQIGPPPAGICSRFSLAGAPSLGGRMAPSASPVNRYAGCQGNGERAGQGSQAELLIV